MLSKQSHSIFKRNDLFPWYDSYWLYSYLKCKEFIGLHHPEKVDWFINAFEVLRTPDSFSPKIFSNIFSDKLHGQMLKLIENLEKSEFEKYEFLEFGRLIKHDLPFFTELQQKLVSFVSKEVGEEVELSYNFLSLYNSLGILNPHMDAAPAKWTLDYCIDQSNVWPIHLSKVLKWPEEFRYSVDWIEKVKADPQNEFKTYELNPKSALLFSGMSQWHYRERISNENKNMFCHLIFFHFIPKGTSDLCYPKKWSNLFGIPELDEIIVDP